MSASASRPAARLPRRASTFRPRSAGLRRIACFLTLLMIWQMVLASPAGVIAQELARHTPPLPKVHDDPAWHTIDYRQSGKSPLPRRSSALPSPSLTLLDGIGQLNRLVPASEPASWKAELHQNASSSAHMARLHLWLGEYVLAHDQQPQQALWHFHRAQKLSSAKDSVLGVAAEDKAIATFFEGAYRQSARQFAHLLGAKHALPDLQRRDLAIWYGHAKACAGYHAERAALGIPEPPQLDPLCGAASLAKCLQAQGQSFDKARVLAAIHVTGQGSSLRDVLDAAKKLGMKAKAIGADEQALMALPKPLVAFVEQDHFVSLIRADKQGVSYLCSDCGPWPGGRVDLSWKQWRKMDASVYVAVYKAGSELDSILTQLMAAKSARQPGGGVARSTAASGLRTVGLGQGVLGRQSALFALLKAHLLLDPPETHNCGHGPSSARCPSFFCCPGDYCKTCQGAGEGDPVNCATGEEEYTPQPDLTVYNPVGPSVVWSRRYDSLRGFDPAYEDDDFGMGWSHPYNVGVADNNILQNWIIPQAGSGSIPATTPALINPTGYPHFPQSGILWNIYNSSHTSIASATSPAGWSVAYDSSRQHLLVNAPSNATVADNYLVTFAQQSGPPPCSANFDIIASSSVTQATDQYVNLSTNTFVTVALTGTDSPATGLTWDILYNGTTIASSASDSAGWIVYYTPPTTNDMGWPVGRGRLQVGAPINAALGSGYEVRYHTTGGSLSGTFSIVAPTLQPTTAAKAVFLDNGAKITFTPSAVPTAAQPRASCTVAAGSPFTVEWDYSSANALGYYRITFTDRSVWVTGLYDKLLSTGGIAYSLSQIIDRNGNYINFVYGNYGPSGFPLLNSINNSNGVALLTFNRAGDGTGNLTSVADNNGRMIFYHESTYPTQNVPTGYPQSYQELDHVSQYGSSTNNNPPNRYVYGYSNISNGEGSETIPFLTSITIPSPTGTGTATANITYAAGTCFVANIVDANGNMRAFSQVDANHTQVQTYNPQNQLVYAYTFGFDSNMSATTVTDGVMNNSGANTEIIYSATYGDPNDPYRQSEVLDGNGYAVGGANNKGLWKYTWDQFGHCTSMTSPYGTVDTFTWNYSNFALGELTEAQEGTKAPISMTYFEPSGLLKSLTGPPPGTTGSNQTESESFTWDSLGNLLTHTIPGNNAGATLTTTYSYTTDGSYNQADAIGQPIAITDPLGHVTHFRYDAQGSITSAADALGNTVTTSYDVSEHPVQIQLPATGQTGSGNTTIQYSYLYVSGPLTQTALYDESGNLFRHVCPVYGKDGETLSSTGDVDPATVTYDACYRTTTYTDGNGHATQFSFNQAGYLSQIQYANGDTVQYPSYDADGNALQKINGRNQQINYLYNDLISQRTDIQYPGSPAINVHISYDEYGRPIGVSDGTGIKAFAYDDLSDLTSVTTTYTNLPSQTLSYAYYPDASRQTMTTPAGTYSYNYDAAQRLTNLINPSNQSSTWSWLNNDWLGSQTNSTGASSVFTYNALGEVTNLSHYNASNTLLSSYSGMTYDAAGNLTGMTSYLNGQSNYSGTTSYQYNNRNEIIQESSNRLGGYTYTYGWDQAGNATTFRGVNRSFNSVNELSTNIYDTDGNATTWDGLNLTFDAENRATAVGSQTFGYSGAERSWANNGTSTTYYLYSDGVPVTELDSNGNVTASNTYGAMGLLSRTTTDSQWWTYIDPFGGTTQTTGVNGSLSTGTIYDLWGQRNTNASGYTDSPIICIGAASGNQQNSGTGIVYPPLSPPINPGSGTAPSRGPIGAGGGNGYTGGYGVSIGSGIDRDSPEAGPMVDSHTTAGSEIGQGIIGDLPAAGRMARTLDSALTFFPPYAILTAITGQDPFNCDLAGWDRGLRGMAASELGAIGEAAEGSTVAARLRGPLGNAETRALDRSIADALRDAGWEITHGAGRKQEKILDPDWVRPANWRGGRKAGTVLPDITATKNGVTLRIQTIDTCLDAEGRRIPDEREQANIDAILNRRPKDRLIWFPKDRTGW